MTVNRETREAVARAIFCTANPGHAWFNEPPAVLEFWGNLADAAIAAYWDATGERAAVPPTERVQASPVEGLAQALGLPQVVENILNQLPLDSTGHVQDCGYDLTDGGCACSTLPQRLGQALA